MAELDPIINDEQALSYTEGLENWNKGLKYLGAVVRFVRNHKKEIPSLKAELANVATQLGAAKAKADADEKALRDKQAFLKAQNDQLGLEQGQKADALRTLKQDVAKREAALQSLNDEIGKAQRIYAETQKSVAQLSVQESDLARKVDALKQEMDRIEKTLPSLLKR